MEYLTEGIQVAVIGFSVVMIALILLWFIMIVFSRVLNPGEAVPADKPGSGTGPGGAPPASRAETEATSTEPPSSGAPAESAEDPRLVAAITAAVSMALSESDGRRFRVKSIRPVQSPESYSWKLLGRKAQQEALPRRSR